MKMKHTVREQWVEALMSGRFKKAVGQLGREKRGKKQNCALGVLCELAVEQGVTNREVDSEGDVRYGQMPHETGQLPPDVREWAGLLMPLPYIGERQLHHMNDRGHMPLDMIGKAIDGDPERKYDLPE